MDGKGGLDRREMSPHLLDLISADSREWVARETGDEKRRFGGKDEKNLDLSLAPPGQEKWNSKACASTSSSIAGNKSIEKRVAPAPVVGWPPIRSARKNLVNKNLAKSPALPQTESLTKNNSETSKSYRKGLFVKINMDGVPIGRKVDINAYGSYKQLAFAVDDLFSGLLAAQRDHSGTLHENSSCQVERISGLLDGSGDYTLVYEDNEGDRMLVGDVPWNMFASAVKRLRVLKSSDLSALHRSTGRSATLR